MLSEETKYIWLAISFCAAIVCYLADNLIAKKITKTGADYYFFLTTRSVIIAIMIPTILPVVSGSFGEASTFTIIFGVLFGLICLLQSFCMLKALKMGPFSYTEVIVALSTLIPTLSGCLFWNEPLIFAQIVGIVLMVICILLSTDKSKDDKQKKATGKWLLISFAAAVLNGFVGVSQKIHQTEHKAESGWFLLSAFIVWTIITVSIFIYKVTRKNDPDAKLTIRFSPFHVFTILGSGLALGLSHIVNLFLAGIFDSATLFPLINVGPLVIATILARVLFKEMLSKKRWIGIVIGIISTFFVSTFIITLLGWITDLLNWSIIG